MKKLILILLLLLGFETVNSQSQYFRYVRVGDSVSIPTGRLNALYYYQGGVLKTFADTALLIGRYDTVKFALRWNTWGQSNLDTSLIGFTNQQNVFSQLQTFGNVAVTGNAVVTGNVTGDTIFANRFNGVSRIFPLVSPATFNPADTSSLHWGSYTLVPQTISGNHQVELPFTCTIVKVYIRNVPTGGGTTENVTHKIKRFGSVASDTASYTITTVGQMTSGTKFYSATVNIPIIAGDKVEMKMTFPNFATNPTTVYLSGYLVYE